MPNTFYSLTSTSFFEGATLYYYDRASVHPDCVDETILTMTVERQDTNWCLRDTNSDLALLVPVDDVSEHINRSVDERVLFTTREEALGHKLHHESHRIRHVREMGSGEMLNELFGAWQRQSTRPRHEQDAYRQTIAELFGHDPR